MIKTQTWYCHHRLETQDKWGKPREEEIPADVLIDLRIYCNRPASELIFLTTAEHAKMHSRIRKAFKTQRYKGHKHSEEAKRKISEAHKGRTAWNKGLITGKHWYTNGITSVCSFECPEGFWAGKTQNTVPWNKGKHWDEETKKKISESVKMKASQGFEREKDKEKE